jgi:Rps23 Pro-64 3,4-dihydroxylase Tpa1-like proline 4-hydroxylase
MPPKLRLNPDLDPADYAEAYARDGVVQIEDIFPAEVADHLFEVLTRQTVWRLVFSTGEDKPVVLSQEQLQAMAPDRRAALFRDINARARDNIGFLYSVWPMIQAYLEKWEPGHPLHAVTEFLQTAEVREFGRAVIGCARITKVDAQATLYGPGHFLTRHRDEGLKLERRAAYTLGFARDWQPDYGGLLAFVDDDLNLSRAYLPRFNVLTLFDGLKQHSVTSVAGFAPIGRYSITGWFRDDPPARSAV